MHADSVAFEPEGAAIDGLDRFAGKYPLHTARDRFRIMQNGSIHGSRCQLTVGQIRPIGKHFSGNAYSSIQRGFLGSTSRLRIDQRIIHHCDHCFNKRYGHFVINRHLVLHGAMWLHVMERYSRGSAHRLHCTDLVDHIGLQLPTCEGHVSPTESDQVRISRMGANSHIIGGAGFNSRQHHPRIACMKTTRDIGTAHQLQHVGIVAHGPIAKALAEIAIDINSHGRSPDRCGAMVK